jgi:dTDP-3-amino-3,4,6-trideoxy-alpha-D-glucose transaminase
MDVNIKMNVPPMNLALLHQMYAAEIEQAVHRVLNSGWYILGQEVEQFEAAFAAYHGVAHAVAVANGTDAIELALRALGIGAGDEVITVAHTAMPTVVAVERAGAVPVLVDIDPITFTMNPEAVEQAITPRTKAILPVHLYGHPAHLDKLMAIAEANNLVLIEDSAQAHGALWNGEKVGTFGKIATFSFYPTKNLGAYGDAGMVITDDEELAGRLRRLRNYGQVDRYHHAERGINSRMDELQAAILGVKLKYLDEQNQARRTMAAVYTAQLKGVTLPQEHANACHIYHLYVIQSTQRDALRNYLDARGVKTIIHYPLPIHRQPSHQDLAYAEGSLPVTEQIAASIVSLPLFIGMTEAEQQYVIDTINSFISST